MHELFESLKDYRNSYYENLLLEGLNEGISIDDLKRIASQIKNPSAVLKGLIEKFNAASPLTKKGIAGLIVILSYSGGMPNNDINKIADQLARVSHISLDTPPDKILNVIRTNPLRFISDLKTSDEMIENIKHEEKLRLVAYDIKDGMITIGYGHAEPLAKTELKPGITRITEEQAEKILQYDIKKFENGVKRMLMDWNNQGIDIRYINQSMFDVMVSIAFNSGISGLRNSEFIVGLKDTDLSNTEELLKVAEKIKTARLKDNNPGLITRRLGEYNWFIRDLLTKV